MELLQLESIIYFFSVPHRSVHLQLVSPKVRLSENEIGFVVPKVRFSEHANFLYLNVRLSKNEIRFVCPKFNMK